MADHPYQTDAGVNNPQFVQRLALRDDAKMRYYPYSSCQVQPLYSARKKFRGRSIRTGKPDYLAKAGAIYNPDRKIHLRKPREVKRVRWSRDTAADAEILKNGREADGIGMSKETATREVKGDLDITQAQQGVDENGVKGLPAKLPEHAS